MQQDITIFLKMINEQKEIDFTILKDSLANSRSQQNRENFVEKTFMNRNSYIRRGQALLRNIVKTKRIIKMSIDRRGNFLPVDDQRTWNVNLRIAFNEFEEIVEIYQKTMATELPLESKQQIKYLILEKAINARPFSDRIYIKMLKSIGFDAQYVTLSGPTNYTFKCCDIDLPLNYTGYLVNGLKEGFGKFTYSSNSQIFYIGQFRSDMIYGPNIQLFHPKKNALLNLTQNPDDYSPDLASETISIINVAKYNPKLTLELSNGSINVFHENGQLQFDGSLKDGQKDCVLGNEYYENGRLRYSGVFRMGGYHGEGIKIFHSH
jgi:hypothetical protein